MSKWSRAFGQSSGAEVSGLKTGLNFFFTFFTFFIQKTARAQAQK